MIDIGISSLPDAYETARELDTIADKLSELVTTAFEGACPQTKVSNKRRPVTPLIMELIRKKRKLRREKGVAFLNGNEDGVRRIQKQMNLVGNEIKKQQKKEQKRRHDVKCQNLAKEKNPKKFFQSVKSLTCTDEGENVRTRTIKDELGNIASTAQERIELFANRLERVHQTPEEEEVQKNEDFCHRFLVKLKV